MTSRGAGTGRRLTRLAAWELRVPPLALAGAAAGSMGLLARATPALAVPFRERAAIASILAIAGVAIALAGVVELRDARTTVSPLSPNRASALVVSGIYGYTRNPMYLGMAILLVAWAVQLSHPLALLGVAAFVAYIHRFQIIPEEKAMHALFPGAFGAYARRVRRWI